MPILPPSLDDRRFDDLVEELLARIPAHTPEWTHPRPGDPGRTLIELFAWLGDALLYRVNLIPERQRLVFLRLLGMGLKPAQAARGIVSLAFAKETELSCHTLQPLATAKAAQPFESVAEVTVLPLSAQAYIKQALPTAELAKRSEVLHGLSRIHRISGALKAYQTTPLFAGGKAQPEGVDVFAQSVDKALWIALFAPPADKPENQATTNANVKLALGATEGGLPALLSVGVVPALKAAGRFDEAVSTPTAVPVLWEMVTQGSNRFVSDYLTLSVHADSSHGLAQAGCLRLQLPDEQFIWAPPNDVGVNPRAGVGDAPPRLDDVALASRLIGWLRLRPKPGEPVHALKLSWLGINAVELDQRLTQRNRVLGVSTGAADQVFSLGQGSVDPDSLHIEVEETGRGYQTWYRVEDLAAISHQASVAREANAFELDAEAGTIRFGDGVRGRVPERERRIRLVQGRFGGGRSGNLAAGSVTELSGRTIDGGVAPPLKVLQALAMSGGEDAETLALAEKRIPARLRHRDRAVTAEDYRQLALEAPAVDVGRVEVLPRFRPRDRRQGMAGVVSVMALPAMSVTQNALGSPNPRPDRPFIERLHSYLSQRSPLATELYVIGAEYVPLGLSLAIRIREGYSRDKTLLEVRAALQALLWPLAPGGFAQQGWPLGRDVKSRELEVEISRVAGVDELRGLQLFGKHNADWQALPALAADGAQTLSLRPWQLPELLAVVVVDGDRAPTTLSAVANPFAQAQAVAVPLVPELC